jgi:hypothetical protein
MRMSMARFSHGLGVTANAAASYSQAVAFSGQGWKSDVRSSHIALEEWRSHLTHCRPRHICQDCIRSSTPSHTIGGTGARIQPHWAPGLLHFRGTLATAALAHTHTVYCTHGCTGAVIPQRCRGLNAVFW